MHRYFKQFDFFTTARVSFWLPLHPLFRFINCHTWLGRKNLHGLETVPLWTLYKNNIFGHMRWQEGRTGSLTTTFQADRGIEIFVIQLSNDIATSKSIGTSLWSLYWMFCGYISLSRIPPVMLPWVLLFRCIYQFEPTTSVIFLTWKFTIYIFAILLTQEASWSAQTNLTSMPIPMEATSMLQYQEDRMTVTAGEMTANKSLAYD